MTTKYRLPDEEEKRILERNGIDPAGMVIEHRSEGSMLLLNHKTRDEILITQGDKKWSEITDGQSNLIYTSHAQRCVEFYEAQAKHYEEEAEKYSKYYELSGSEMIDGWCRHQSATYQAQAYRMCVNALKNPRFLDKELAHSVC